MSATKIVVRNVAFEATKRDIQKLFNPFGTLKAWTRIQCPLHHPTSVLDPHLVSKLSCYNVASSTF
jgi:hypothetical protein